MTAGLKPYPAMKDSGVEWLGQVPAHWEVRRLKTIVANIVDQTPERNTSEPYVALEHVESWTGQIREAEPDASFDSQVKRFQAGDILFGKLRPYLAKVARPTCGGVCVGEFLVLRPRVSEAAAPYFEQLLRSKPIIDAINGSTSGAKMPRADWRFVGGMAVTLPPSPEQTAIVKYLDYYDRRIRRYVRAKRKLVKLLQEQKQAVIHRAVNPRPRPGRAPEGLRRRVAGPSAGALGGAAAWTYREFFEGERRHKRGRSRKWRALCSVRRHLY